MSTNKPSGPAANPADKSPPDQPSGIPRGVRWLRVPTSAEQADPAWINIERSPTDTWCFPRTRLIGCTWANPQVLQLEFTTHTIQVQAASVNTAEDLAEGILAGKISTLLLDSSLPHVDYPNKDSRHCGWIEKDRASSTNPAYELLPESH